jgi:hypothetical protein
LPNILSGAVIRSFAISRIVATLVLIVLAWGLASASKQPFCDERDNATHSSSLAAQIDCLEQTAPESDDDPCHKGLCHFGHCLHLRILPSSYRSELHSISGVKSITPYNTRKIIGVSTHPERPPIAQV